MATIYMLINVVCWGAALPVVKYGLEYTTPFRYLLYRYFFAIIFSLPLLFYYWPKVRNKVRKISLIVALELLGTTFALAALYIGLNQTSALSANVIGTALPFFITVGGVIFLREKQEKNEWLGSFLALAGTLLLIAAPLIGNFSQSSHSWSGNIWIMIQNFAAAAYFLLAKKRYAKLPKLFVVIISSYVGMVSFAALSFFEVGFSLSSLVASIQMDLTHPAVWLIALYMATFGTLIGLTAYIRAQDGMEASEAGLFGYLQPLVYFPLSIFLLAESISWVQLISLGLIILGEVIAQKRKRPATQ